MIRARGTDELGVLRKHVGCKMLDVFSGIEIVLIVLIVVVQFFMGLCIGKVLQKAGKPLWAGFVPIYNYMLLLEIVGRPSWWIILLLIPFVNVVVMIIACIDLAKSFGKDAVWGLLLAFVSVIGWPMLAFGDATYQGPSVTNG